ncbi:MAG: hypothetical protein AAGA48_37545 [Myxococcota bacterium]
MSTESTGSSSEETGAAAAPAQDGTADALAAILARLDQLETKIDAAHTAAQEAKAAASVEPGPPTNGAGAPIAVAQLHDPDVQAGLGRILERIDRVEAMVEALGTFAERLPVIGDAMGHMARLGYEQAQAKGIDPIATGQRALDLGLSAASPQTFDLLEKLLQKQGTLMALLDAVEDLEDDNLAAVGTALVETYRSPIPMAGPLRAFFALGDPDIMRTVGFTLEFAKKLGSKLRAD